ncbi:MAG: glycosyl transferase [Pyrinomonadaceae bacterium]|nr:glycosyl transferase [Pyrinomonadaceae bacterium]
MKKQKTLLFYCQHSLGIGHLIRSFAVAEALSERFRVVFVSGGKLPRAVRLPSGIEYVQIPPVGAGPDGELVSQDGRRDIALAWSLRRTRLLDIFQQLKPSVLLIEFYPFGRLQFSGELLPLLDAARLSKPQRPLVLCSLRDIVERRMRKYQFVYDDLVSTLVNNLYDGVLFHADPRFARLEETFQSSVPLSTPIYYTGFVTPHRELPGTHVKKNGADVIVSAGGGRCGGPLVQAAVEAYKRYGIGDGLGMTIVAGPFMPQAEWETLRAAATDVRGLKVRRWFTNFRAELSSAKMSVSQCGYNTTMDLLNTRTPALVVPYVNGEEREQMHRARKLERFGKARVLEPERMDARSLAAEIRETLNFRPSSTRFDMSGVAKTSSLIESLVF